jgi:hypothetical protein
MTVHADGTVPAGDASVGNVADTPLADLWHALLEHRAAQCAAPGP